MKGAGVCVGQTIVHRGGGVQVLKGAVDVAGGQRWAVDGCLARMGVHLEPSWRPKRAEERESGRWRECGWDGETGAGLAGLAHHPSWYIFCLPPTESGGW